MHNEGAAGNDVHAPAAVPVARAAPLQAIPVHPPTAPPDAGPALLTYAGYGTGIWREGALLAFQKGAVLATDRCVKCNAPAAGKPLRRHLSWHHPAIYFTLLLGVVAYIIVAVIVRKPAMLHIGLCRRHKFKRRLLIAAGLALFIGAFPFAVIAIDMESWLLAGFAMATFIGGLVFLMIASQIISAKKIDDHHAWVRGVGPEFLATLPGNA